MNICFFNLTEPAGEKVGNGVVRVAATLAVVLRERGHRVEFYGAPPKSSLKKLGVSAGTHFRNFLRERKIDVAVWQMGSCRVPFSLKNLPCRLIAVWHNAPNFRNEDYALRLCESYKIRARPLRRIFLSRLARSAIQRVYEIYRSRAFDYTCGCSDRFVLLSEKFIPDFPPARAFPQKIRAIANPAPYAPQSVDFSKKKKDLLFVGRLNNGQKRLDLLLKIWARLEARFPEWRLRIVGDGPDAGRLKRLAGTLRLERASFEGFRDPAPFYRDAAIFCMTSAFEGFPMVLVEAAAFGCVPVAFDSFAAVHDIIDDGENGILVPAFDLDKYAETLAELMSDDALRERLALAARERVANFSADKIAARWEALFEETLR